MSFYEELYKVRDEYNKFQRLEQSLSSYTPLQVITIFKTLLENYEDEEYDASINEFNQLIALPSDKDSKSLKLEINNLYNGDAFYKSMNNIIIFPYNINKYINVSSFQSDMQINYLSDFFTSFVEYRYSNGLSSIKDDKLIDFLDEYMDLKKDDILSYQEQKKKCLDAYTLWEEERRIEVGFMVDKYNIINCVKDFINENYDANLKIFDIVNEAVEGWYSDKDHAYLDYYRTIGLKDNDNIVFEIKEFSYKAEDEIDAYRFNFYYDGSKCVDRDINVYKLKSKMKDLIQKYPKLNKYFFVLDEKYRELLKDNFGIVDSEKIKKLVGKSF